MRLVVIESAPSASRRRRERRVSGVHGEQVAVRVDPVGEGPVDQAEAVVQPARPDRLQETGARRGQRRAGEGDLGGRVRRADGEHGAGTRAVVDAVPGAVLPYGVHDPAHRARSGIARQVQHDPAALGRRQRVRERGHPAVGQTAHLLPGQRPQRAVVPPSRFSVSSCSRTGTPSRVRRTSNSAASAPLSSAERSEASVFSPPATPAGHGTAVPNPFAPPAVVRVAAVGPGGPGWYLAALRGVTPTRPCSVRLRGRPATAAGRRASPQRAGQGDTRTWCRSRSRPPAVPWPGASRIGASAVFFSPAPARPRSSRPPPGHALAGLICGWAGILLGACFGSRAAPRYWWRSGPDLRRVRQLTA
ncbi:hypothetical protein SHIRM173S_05182 [Streptomyces hirsutus]